ncbi:MAG TPA: Na(+)-translocating NADH-quinone reductase subunit A, partial [Amaricoccus sp.]|nr:Na(+)-translocating NADH-quinone reductase subunit A [Amaricoccus sp.]
VRTVMGASLRDLTASEVAPGGRDGFARILSGSVLAGREAAWLGRHHHQVTILDARPEARRLPLPRWLGRPGRGPRPLIASERLEGLLPFGIPPVPLMRALAVGDSETAERLGALDLVEEDVALLSCFCTSGADYGRLLRRVLDDLAEAA